MRSSTPSRARGAALAVLCVSALTACDDPVVMQDNRHTERTYEQQSIRWLKWALAQPHSTASPIADETGEFCTKGQSGKVWYLAGTFGGPVERACSIPANRYLFFPLINRWGLNPGTSIDDEAAQADFIAFFEEYFPANRAATCVLTLRLDGEDLLGTDLAELDEALYVDVLDPFEVDINPDNYASGFGFEGGITPMLADGHFALLRPLEAGEHVLEFGGSTCEGEAIDFETFATYTLTVLP